ncbi:MAG: family N-acetyltransferase [Firmicutes bacterium]|nr:family N-acetyltransferase [Bacillota bacterium]
MLVTVSSGHHIRQIQELLHEYQAMIGIDLCFQEFEQEVQSLPGKYAPPRGCLYLAVLNEIPAGCIALRPLNEVQCEMKRLYVRPAFRGRGLAKQLTERIIDDARKIGYRQIVLDTLAMMTVAQALYHSLGFREIEPYCFNPLEGVRYMGLDL